MHSDQSTIEFVNELLADAIINNISDIHIEPFPITNRIRYRQDGILKTVNTISTNMAKRVTTRLKIMASLNIAEKRLPQDGKMTFDTEKPVDIRINTCPTLHGEKVTLRLHHSNSHLLEISNIGMTEEQKQLFITALNQPHGLILMTGSTGSGKTVTLYAALNRLNTIDKNIVTVEDPVEIDMPGINQINIHSQIGLTFPVLLRTLLRQDPDIIMIGEIRDAETALIAMQAAQTGHLVLSTLHANSPQNAMTRLQAMGIPEHYMTDSLTLVIHQRLVTLSKGGRTGVFQFLEL